jgi:hypothetical protein
MGKWFQSEFTYSLFPNLCIEVGYYNQILGISDKITLIPTYCYLTQITKKPEA